MTTNFRQTETFVKLTYADNQLSISTNGIYLSINPQELALSKDMLLALAPKMLKSFGVTEGKCKALLESYSKVFISNFIDSLALSFKHNSGRFDIECTLNEEGNLNCRFDGNVDFQIINYLSDLKSFINQLTEGE